MKVLLRVVVVVLLAAAVGFGLSALSDPSGGADIGAGVLAFALVVLVSFVWSLLDGRRAGLGRVLLRWLLVAVLVGAFLAAFPQIGSDTSFDLQVYLGDLPESGPFGAALVFVPALVGALIGRLIGGRRARTEPVAAPADA
ncbi:hypothetical protein [Phycicoccus flavus]|uniref:hypothetical protein n=1 Tax=Phycicoccus flavus TaxID=2502783 RepID=UPI000FEBFE0A|nr:hypothetical protein [Phycicoccus flavus]NHA67172.1 hypothetical protein [Phycicoccus flavus]